MDRLRKVSGLLCMTASVMILIGVCVSNHLPVQPERYFSEHAAATMAPLMGFSADSLVNTGDAKALDALPGVGTVIAERILLMREQLGVFRMPEDLLLVKGIGEKTMTQIMEAIDEPLVLLEE